MFEQLNDSIQSDNTDQLKHFLSAKDLSHNQIKKIITTAQSFFDRENKISDFKSTLSNKIAANLFFETSTRTRISFEVAAHKLGVHVIDFNHQISSTKKGESLSDTLHNLIAMGIHLFIVRHQEEHLPTYLAEQTLDKASIINAGDGRNEHPTQAMLDIFTIHRYKPNFKALSIAIVGDILHSRVANSLSWALHHMGTTDIRWVAPSSLLPKSPVIPSIRYFDQLKYGIENVDVIVVLRLQRERMSDALSLSADDYFKHYGLTAEVLKNAKSDAIVMHPGPLNRHVEIAPDVADGKQSVILEQVTNGIAVRMAIMKLLLERFK